MVDILLSTYNGELYLKDQIDSIINQTYCDWRLIVRDDGSSDGSLSIIEGFRKQYPDKIFFLKDTLGNIGYNLSFFELLRYSSADYIMYCDQDDVWMNNKVEILLALIKANETVINNSIIPHLAFADLHVVNKSLDSLHDSFLNLMGFVENKGLEIYLLKNYCPGCNIIFNKSLKSCALQVKNHLNVHDFLLSVIAGSIGKISYTNKTLMFYRIHDSNAIGIKSGKSNSKSQFIIFVKNCVKYMFNNKRYRSIVYSENIMQMKELAEVFSDRLSKEACYLANISTSNYIKRKINNFTKPYVLYTSYFEQLTYVFCF